MKHTYAYHFAAFLLTAVLTISGCKKTEDIAVVTGRVKTHTFTDSGYPGINFSEKYTYDERGRLTYVEYENGTHEEIVYSTSQVTEMFDDTVATTPPSFVTYNLNAQGLAVNRTGGISYTYDTDGYLVKETYGLDSFIYYNYVQGNMVARSLYEAGLVKFYSTRNFFTDVQDFRDFGRFYKGKNSKNIVSSISSSLFGEYHSYEFDAKKRVVKETVTTNTGQVIEHLYTYY